MWQWNQLYRHMTATSGDDGLFQALAHKPPSKLAWFTVLR